MTGFEIANVRVKVGGQWVTVPQSSQLEWKLIDDTSTWAAKVDVEVTWKSTLRDLHLCPPSPSKPRSFLTRNLKDMPLWGIGRAIRPGSTPFSTARSTAASS